MTTPKETGRILPCSDAFREIEELKEQIMPCSDGRSNYGDYRSGYAAGEDSLRGKLEAMKEMLCSACRVLERLEYDFDENPELSKWWDGHKKEDERKAKEEAQRLLEVKMCHSLINKLLGQLSKDDLSLLRKHKFLS